MSNVRPRFAEVTAKLNTILPKVFLQTYTSIPTDKTLFRITASHSKGMRDMTISDYQEMVASLVDNKMQMIAASFEPLDDVNTNKVFSCLLRGNSTSKPADDTNMGRMALVSANVFRDKDDDAIWKLVGEGEGKRLVLAVKENMEDILKSRITRMANTVIASQYANYNGITPNKGDYCVYWSTASDALAFGTTAPSNEGIHILNRNTMSVEKVVAAQIIDSVDAATIAQFVPEVKAADMINRPAADDFTSGMANEYLNYYSKLYAGTTFYDRLTALMANRRGYSNDPLVTRTVV